MVVLLGLVVALGYGTADFLGGYATRVIAPWVALLGTQAVGAAAGMAYAVALGGPVTGADVAWSAAAGAAVVSGLACLYRGIARGRAVVVAPVSAAGAAIIQFGWGLVQGERPGALALVGAGLALAAVVVLSVGDPTETGADRAEENPGEERLSPLEEVLLSVGAAVGLGISLVLLAQTDEASGLWPIVLSRVLPLPLLLIPLLPALRGLTTDRRALGAVAGAGVLDASANALLLVLVRRDLFSIVAPAAALYPVATVVLARLVFQQRVRRFQLGGLAVAATGLGLLALGR